MKNRLLCMILSAMTIFYLTGCGNSAPKDDPLTIHMPEDGTLRIAQFSDFHFGIEGEDYHNADEARTIQFMDHIVESTNPDFIVLTGDNIMCTGMDGIKKLVSRMDKYETP